MGTPLRWSSPVLYQYLVEALSANGMSPYDIDGQVIKDSGFHTLVISYGSEFTCHANYMFECGEWEMAQTGFFEPTLHQYFDKTISDVKARLVKDYRKGMKQKL